MGLIATIQGKRIEGLGIAISLESKTVQIFDHEPPDATSSPVYEIAYPFSDTPKYSDSDYYVALLAHSSWPQSKVLTLRKDKNAVGALFSIEVLSSGFADDPEASDRRKVTMEQYAAIALRKLSKGEVRGSPLINVDIDPSSTSHISSFYHPDTVVAIFTIKHFFPEDIQSSNDATKYNEFFLSVLPSFYGHGLFPNPWPGSPLNDQHPVRYRKFQGYLAQSNQERNFDLEQFSDKLEPGQKDFLLTMFQEIDPHETNPFFRFFLYYQVFELWMQEIFVETISSFRTSIGNSENEDTTLFRDKLYILNSALNEKYRLGRVFSSNPLNGQVNDLVLDACNSVLTRCGQTNKLQLNDAFYSVRNRLVHGFNQAKMARPEFDKLADITLELICHISKSYTPPSATIFV